MIPVHFLKRNLNKRTVTKIAMLLWRMKVALTMMQQKSLSAPKKRLFISTRRYEESYDVYDARYVSWIQANHPEGNGEKLLNFFPDVTPLDSICIINPDNYCKFREHMFAFYAIWCTSVTNPYW